jgi:hypothetical protein
VNVQQVALASIELDTSIQCRAAIDTAVVNDYAERMAEGDEFPPVDLFGTKGKWWLGDGWHRVMAARQNGSDLILANLKAGGRSEALKHALAANSVHGHRRSNADKRRCVEIALREFPKLSSRAVAKLCGVSNHMVDDARPDQLGDSPSSTRTGLDGKERPAHRPFTVEGIHKIIEEATPALTIAERNLDRFAEESAHAAPEDRTSGVARNVAQQAAPSRKLAPPSNGMQFARMAIMDLEQIRPDDTERSEALAFVKEWIDAREN